jgi:glycosyltransferase involved in cell wall biosynthesis
MKIGFDVAQTCMEKAGCGHYADALIHAMVEVEPNNDYFLYHQFGTWINSDTSQGTAISAPRVTATFTDVSPGEAARIWQSPDELKIKTGGPHIVHANCFQAPKVPGAILVYTVYDVSFWAVPHFTTEANRLLCQRGMLQAIRNADAFVFISESAYEEFNRLLPRWLQRMEKPWVVTPLGSRNSNNVHAEQLGERDFWLAVGSLEPRKNYECLLTAMEIYWQRSAKRVPLKIAGGSGWKSGELRRRMAELENRGIVRYLGYVPETALAGLYTQARALVFPSWYEGFGLPILEAMSSACPVICSANTSMKEVGGHAPLYINPNSPESIVDAMLLLESSEETWQERRAYAIERTAHFSWAATARKTFAFYSSLT